jgi:aminoglycoside phosphotransferase
MIKLPQSLSNKMGNPEWTLITLGCSAAQVYRLLADSGEVTYLKVLERHSHLSLQEENERLEWLHGKLPVPEVKAYLIEQDHEFLWTSEVVGVHAADRSWANQLTLMVPLLAKGLREIHQINVADCPFDKRLNMRIQEVEHNIIAGLVDEDDFDIERMGKKAVDLFLELKASIPKNEDLVFTHGDYCLPNIIIHENNIGGFIDWGTAG